MVLRIRYESSWPGPSLVLNEDGSNNNDETFIIIWKCPLCYTHLPVQSRESSGRTLNQDIACMILYNFTDSPKRPSEPHSVHAPPPPQKISPTQTAGFLCVKPPLWGEPQCPPQTHPLCPVSAQWPRACQNHGIISLKMRLGLGYRWSQVSCRREWCWDGDTKPISGWAPSPVGWGRDRPTMVTCNLLAFVGLSQSLNDIWRQFLSVNIYNSVRTPRQLVMHFEVC